MKKLLFIAAVLAMASCSKNDESLRGGAKSPVTIDPTITRATEVDFESGDAIGLTISNNDGTYADNAKLVFDGSVFSSEDGLLWYDDLGLTSTLKAYYPYAETTPSTFAVQVDQTGDGYAASDFMMAAKENVTPSVQAVGMTFKHKMTKIVIRVTNEYGMNVESITISNSAGTATVDCDAQTVAAADDAQTVSITAHTVKANEEYAAILVPQTVALRVDVAADGEVHTQRLAEAALQSGGQYSMSVTLLPTDIDVTLSGDIEDWDDKGSLDGSDEVSFEEYDDYFIYDGERYGFKKFGNDIWMTENLRYVPAGKKVSADPTENTGIWYPYIVEEDGNGNEPAFGTTDAQTVKRLGLLYDAATIFNVKEMTAEVAGTLEGAQGICPKGWHIPTFDDIMNLVGQCNKRTNLGDSANNVNNDAVFFDSNYNGGCIATMNEAGFGFTYSGNLIGSTHKYQFSVYDKSPMTYLWGSQYYPGSQVQFISMGSTKTATTYVDGRLSGLFNNYNNGSALRCVKDKE